MRYTLLKLVQLILSSMDSDEVNSIFDTAESLQVVNLIETVYNDIITQADKEEHYSLFNLVASGTADKPTLMTVPESVSRVSFVKYNAETLDDTDAAFKALTVVSLPDFLDMMHSLSESGENVGSFEHISVGQTNTFFYRNDKAPSCYTSFDDYTMIFDSYDAAVDSTLQSSKTMCYGLLIPTFTRSNIYVPDLNPNQFTVLLNEAKALAFAELKQSQHIKAEVNSKRGRIKEQKNRERVMMPSFFSTLPHFGRK